MQSSKPKLGHTPHACSPLYELRLAAVRFRQAIDAIDDEFPRLSPLEAQKLDQRFRELEGQFREAWGRMAPRSMFDPVPSSRKKPIDFGRCRFPHFIHEAGEDHRPGFYDKLTASWDSWKRERQVLEDALYALHPTDAADGEQTYLMWHQEEQLWAFENSERDRRLAQDLGWVIVSRLSSDRTLVHWYLTPKDVLPQA